MYSCETYDDVKLYLENAIKFLDDYSWIYNFPITHLLVDKIFDKMPPEWVECFNNVTNEELNSLNQPQLKIRNSPDSLKKIFGDLNRLKVTHVKKSRECLYKFPNNSGLSKKKQHEILLLAPLIHEVCNLSGCEAVLDVGAGLGYLPQLLFEKYKYAVLGIEGSSQKVKSAQSNQEKYPQSKDSVKYIHHFVTPESQEEIRKIVGDLPSNYCISGLHACADLSVTILDLFTKLEHAKALVIMPCCYHRLEVKQGRSGFKHFPASIFLRDFVKNKDFLKIPFLRLACQTVEGFKDLSEEEHEEHANNCLFRAILQEVAQEENCEVRRLKRKSGVGKNQSSDPFEAYLTTLQHTHALIGGQMRTTDEDFRQRMREKWNVHKGNRRLVEALAGLQGAMQSICENVVLLDRVAFLQERGVTCIVEKVTDEGLSPRCHALVALKP